MLGLAAYMMEEPRPSDSGGGDGSAAKKRRIWAACELCRKRKSRCDGQNPCKGCLNTVKASAVASSSSSADPQSNAAGSGGGADEAAWIAKAKEICVFDWNRKPRGPKAKKRPGSSQSTDASNLGAPRTEASAGAAYVQSQHHQLGRALSHSDADSCSFSRSGLFPLEGAPSSTSFFPLTGSSSFSPLTSTATTVSDSALSISSSGPAHMLAAAPARGQASSGADHPDTFSAGTGSSMLHRFSASSPGQPIILGEAAGASQITTATMAFSHASQSVQSSHRRPVPTGYSPAIGYPAGNLEHSPLQDNGAFSDSTTARREPPPLRPVRGDSLSGIGGIDASSAPPFMRHRRNSNTSLRSSAQYSGASSGARSRTALSPERSNDSVAAATAIPRVSLASSGNGNGIGTGSGSGSGYGYGNGSPASETAITRFAEATALSPPPDAVAPCDRYTDQLNLINRLRPYCSDQDRPLVAIALAHVSEFDSHEKLVPSRYLFGQAAGLYPEPPAFLLLALLALLSHRALLLPDDFDIEDLDLRAGPATLRCAAQMGRLEGDDRQQMLQFARRCWSLSCDIMLQKICAGEVDPRLVQCGLFLDLGAVEDGISSTKMAKMKHWLFRVLFCWRLHQLDLSSDSPEYDAVWEPATVLRRAVEYAGDVGDSGDDLPLPRIVDARGTVTDPIEREALRRTVIFITCSAYWVATSDMLLPRFDLFSMVVDSRHRDDFIHQASNWTPKPRTRTNEFMQQTRYHVFRVYARIVRLLHTPLLDICTGRSPEPDLQRALSEMEADSDRLRARIGEMSFHEPSSPIKMAALVQQRLVEVMLYRLHLAITAFHFLFTAQAATPRRPDPSLKLATTMVPKEREHRSGFERIAGDGAPGQIHGAAQQTGGGHEPQQQAWPSDDNGGDEGPLALLPRPTCSRSPFRACFASILEMGAIARRLLEMHRAREAALAPLEALTVEAALSSATAADDKVGTGTGRTMDGILRSVRWPRHWRTIAQHTFAMAAETHVAGSSWGSTFTRHDPSWIEPASFAFLPASEHKDTLEAAMWETGETIAELLEAIGSTGSRHSATTAEITRQYGKERYEWAMRYSQPTAGDEQQQQQRRHRSAGTDVSK